MPVCLRDGSARTAVRAATLQQKLQIKLAISPGHSILTQGQPVPALTLQHQAPSKCSHWSANFEVTVMTRSSKGNTWIAGFKPRVLRPQEGRLTTGRSGPRVNSVTRSQISRPRGGRPTTRPLRPHVKSGIRTHICRPRGGHLTISPPRRSNRNNEN